MPSFTFEKLTQPTGDRVPTIEKKQSGVIATLLDRFAEARMKRILRHDKGLVARPAPKTRD
jgi:hypothetical protein